MTINPREVNKYLDRDFENFYWLKDISEEKVDDLIAGMRPRPKLDDLPLWLNQKVGFLLGISFKEYLFQYDMGTGKTFLTLAIFRYLLQIGKIRKALIVPPRDTICDGWADEIKAWTRDIPYVLLQGSVPEKWDAYDSLDEGLIIASHQSLSWMVCEKEKVKRGRKKAKIELVVQDRLMRRLLKGVDAVAWDEITACGNHGSLWFHIANKISKSVEWRFGLAGKIFGRDPEKAWAPFYLIDRGESLGPTLGFFREAFFTKKKAYFGGPHSYDYKFDRKKEEDFARACANRSLRYSSDECQELPPLVAIQKSVRLPLASIEFYNRAVKELQKARGNYKECQNAFLRMRQISSGFVGFKDDDTGEKAQLEFDENPKLDLLLGLIEDMPDDRKFVIAVDFTYSGALISAELRKKKIKHGWLYGATRNWPDMKYKFDNDPDFQGLVIQNQKGAYGLNLQSANYMFIYESPVAVLDREQLEKRCRRGGQKRTTFQFDLIMKGTADETILKFHKEGSNLFKALVSNPEMALRND